MHLIGSKTQAKTQFIVYTEYGFWWPFWNANAFPITFFCCIDLRLVWARFGCWLPFSYIVTKRLTDIFIVNSLFLYIFFIVFCNDCYYLASVCISICTGKRNLLNDETSFSYSIAYETFPFVVNCGSRIKYVHFRQMRFHDSAIRQQFKKFTFSQIF